MQLLADNIKKENVGYNQRVTGIIRLAYINESKDWKFYLHQHNCHCEIMYVDSGEGTYTIDHSTYSVHSGDVVLINQDVGHVQISNPDDPICAWNLGVTLRAVPGLAENHLIPENYKPVIHAGDIARDLSSCFQRLYQECTGKDAFFEASALLCAETCILYISRLIRRSEKLVAKKESLIADEIKAYIDSHYMENITLDTLAQEYFVSKYYLSHQMKKNYGISPIDYLISRRIGEAQNLLCVTDKSITEIAGVVGYSDVNYFNKLFNRRVGVSPTQFRNNYVHI